MSKAVKLARAVGTGGVLEDGEIQAAQVTGLATVASTNSYTDLINKPTIPSITGLASESYVNTQINNLIDNAPGTLNTLKEIADQLATDQSAVGALTAVVNSKASTASLAAVATSGSYNDLLNKPAGGTTYIKKTGNYTAADRDGIIADTAAGSFTVFLPATPGVGTQVNIVDGHNWGTNSLTVGRNGSTIEGLAEDLVLDIAGVSVQLIYDGVTWEVFAQAGVLGVNTVPASSVSGLAPVATSGSYADLTNKPTLATVATSGSYADLTNKPTLATVATSGSYTDLTNKPTVISLKVSSIDYPGDDLAADPIGGQVVTLTGTGFEATPTVYIGGVVAPSVTFVSSTELLVTTPARAAGTYDIYVVNPGGATAIMVFGISYSGTPAWTTTAGNLGTFTGTFSIQLQAVGDAPVSYSLTAGSTLPSGVTLSSSGLLSGIGLSFNQTFNFSVTAIDGQNQDTPRSFSVTVTLADPFFRNISLLLQGNGTNGSQNNTFLDSSTNNFGITRNGNTTQGSFSPYGTLWSNYFDGIGDGLSVANNSAFQFGTGDYTVEAWVFIESLSENYSIIAKCSEGNTWGNGWTLSLSGNGNGFDVWHNASMVISSNTGFARNTWLHVAVSRNGETVRLYINGVLAGSSAGAQNLTPTAPVLIGIDNNFNSYQLRGYISNLRVVKGTGLYTSNFTLSTAPLTAVSGTSLLTCQSNRFRDNSTNNFAVTGNGNASVQRFNPFAPLAEYNAATLGGSGYFDGTGDFLTIPGSAAFNFGTGDYTVEGWVNVTSTTFTLCATGGPGSRDQFVVDSGILYWGFQDGTPFTNGITNFFTASDLNQWIHIAVTRSGTTQRYFKNGVPVSTVTTSSSYGSNTDAMQIGRRGDGSYLTNGYISNLRVVKGIAVYTSAFTPPTAPVTAIANTSLLCNFTNAAIFDSAMMNDLETVGNAQISTSVKRFGTGSLAFDGSGDYLATRSTPNLAFGSGDFTIECWAYANSLGSYNALFAQWPDNGGSANNSYVLESVGSNMEFYWVSGTTFYGPVRLGTIATGSWNHWAICRSGNTLYPFKNGVLGTTISITEVLNSPASPVTVGGAVASAGGSWDGFIDDLRITKGVARYTANFTPPAQAFPAS